MKPTNQPRVLSSNHAYLEGPGIRRLQTRRGSDYHPEAKPSGEGRAGRVLWNDWKRKERVDNVRELLNRLHPLEYNRNLQKWLKALLV